MMAVTGDTLTYTLGAMRPETASASVITADADAKQLALNKVSCCCWLEMDYLWFWKNADFPYWQISFA